MKKILLYAEEVLSDIVFGGFENVSASGSEKLEIILKNLRELGMSEGCAMIEKIHDELACFHRKETDGTYLCELLCRFEFYLRAVQYDAGG